MGFAANADAQNVTTYASVKSDYSFPEFGFTQYDGAVFQGGVTASWENGFFLDIWGSEPLDGNSQGREYDYTAGWGGMCGSMSCTFSVAGFDLPTPDVGDMDFTGSDIIRFRAEVSNTVEIDGANNIRWMLGIDQLTGLIETNLWRSSASWNHNINADWSTSLLVGATHNSDTDFTSAHWSMALTRSFGNWSANASIGAFERQDGVTSSIGISRTW